jgi:dolichyl-phosphate-mannose-protein mannosyltransferase
VTATATAPVATPRADSSTVRETLLARLLQARDSGRFWGWFAPILVAVVGGALRFWRLDQPRTLMFDETYYVKEAGSYLRSGYELATVGAPRSPDALWNAGNTDVWTTTPEFVVHPPVGKWMIAAGEWLVGQSNPVGWRLSAAVVGTVSILMMGRIARRLFGSTLLGTTAALLLSLDGQHFVHSRIGLLDIFVMFWALAGFGALLIDRDQARTRLAARVARRAAQTGGTVNPLSFGPGLGIRWWRLVAGVCLGLCCGTKWSGIYFTAAFALASVLWDVAARRAVGTRHWLATGLLRDGASGALHLLPTALATYLASWAGWFHSNGAWDRQWGSQNPSTHFGWVPASLKGALDALRSLWYYHVQMWHSTLSITSKHDYQSNPWSWLVQGRPTSYAYTAPKPGEQGCTAADCVKAVTALGNPVIWWGGTLAIVVVLAVWLFGRDWRAGAILAGIAGGYLPWFLYQHRTIFTFYTVAYLPYLVLALTFCLALILGRPGSSPDRRLYGAVTAGSIVTLAVLAFAWFYPIWSNDLISHPDWVNRMWLPSWI